MGRQIVANPLFGRKVFIRSCLIGSASFSGVRGLEMLWWTTSPVWVRILAVMAGPVSIHRPRHFPRNNGSLGKETAFVPTKLIELANVGSLFGHHSFGYLPISLEGVMGSMYYVVSYHSNVTVSYAKNHGNTILPDMLTIFDKIFCYLNMYKDLLTCECNKNISTLESKIKNINFFEQWLTIMYTTVTTREHHHHNNNVTTHKRWQPTTIGNLALWSLALSVQLGSPWHSSSMVQPPLAAWRISNLVAWWLCSPVQWLLFPPQRLRSSLAAQLSDSLAAWSPSSQTMGTGLHIQHCKQACGATCPACSIVWNR